MCFRDHVIECTHLGSASVIGPRSWVKVSRLVLFKLSGLPADKIAMLIPTNLPSRKHLTNGTTTEKRDGGSRSQVEEVLRENAG